MSSHGKRPGDPGRPTQPAGKALPDDEAIPVLTERLTLPSLELDISLPPTAAPPPPSPAPAATPAPAPAAPTAEAPVATPAPAPAAAPPSTTHAAESPPATPASAPVPTDAELEEASAEEEIIWATIEERAREALLRELQPRLSAELDRQLRERLQPTLVRMLLATLSELRPSIEAAVRDAASRAVAAEIARQRSRK